LNRPRRFLLIDDHADGRSLISRTLHRKFPQSVTLECVDAEAGLGIAAAEALDAVIVHRAGQHTAAELVELVRAINPTIPILVVSGYDRSAEVLAAGANKFLHYDQWLLVGTTMAELLSTQ
jgi:DNA-binding NarL/FixJ family response regulator